MRSRVKAATARMAKDRRGASNEWICAGDAARAISAVETSTMTDAARTGAATATAISIPAARSKAALATANDKGDVGRARASVTRAGSLVDKKNVEASNVIGIPNNVGFLFTVGIRELNP